MLLFVENLSNDHETNFLRFIGNSLIDLIWPPEGDDDEERGKVRSSSRTSRPTSSSNSNNSSTMSFDEIFMIFRDVATLKETRQAVRLMLLSSTPLFLFSY